VVTIGQLINARTLCLTKPHPNAGFAIAVICASRIIASFITQKKVPTEVVAPNLET
jgi:hypothetical protein